jgi:integrase
MLDQVSGPTAILSGDQPTLADLLRVLKASAELSATRLRDLRSAVNRVAALLDKEPRQVPLDLSAIRAKLAAINPIGSGLSPKTFSNIRSDFLTAVRVSGMRTVARRTERNLSPGWMDLTARAPNKRIRIGLSRLGRFAGSESTEPSSIDDAALARFIGAVREGSLHRKPNELHRTVATIWNELVAAQPELGLRAVTVPSFKVPARRIEWSKLSDPFRSDVDQYLKWCSISDPFDPKARLRPLASQTLQLRRDQIHAGITALVESGINLATVTSLAALVTPDALKRILRRRLEASQGRINTFNHAMAKALVQIAREWVKVDAASLSELNRLANKMPAPLAGLTDKNKRFLRQFDDPAVMQRLHMLAGKLWDEVKREQNPNSGTLAKAQVAVALALLTYMPIRPKNLAALTFDIHLFMRSEARAISTVEIAGCEVKNRTELAFDIPSHVAKLLIAYRDRIVPKITGHRPQRLFVNRDGTAKHQKTVSDLIIRYVKRRAGINLTPHQFRHLNAKIILDAEPGSFELVKQLLGHTNLKTTVSAYAGIDSRRAGRHHQRLVEQALIAQAPRRRRPS